jgi:hypothetical protein
LHLSAGDLPLFSLSPTLAPTTSPRFNKTRPTQLRTDSGFFEKSAIQCTACANKKASLRWPRDHNYFLLRR